jgi:hypothetical protein
LQTFLFVVFVKMNDAFGRYGFVVEDGDFEAEAVLQQGV